MIEFRNLKPSELEQFQPKSLMVDFVGDMVKNINHPDREVMGMWRKDKFLCVLGVNFLRPGVGEVWLIPSVYVDRYPCEFFKAVYRLINNYLLGKCSLHRVEMAVEYGWQKGVKWAEKLGFQLEGVMEAYDLNYRDHFLFAKVVTHG